MSGDVRLSQDDRIREQAFYAVPTERLASGRGLKLPRACYDTLSTPVSLPGICGLQDAHDFSEAVLLQTHSLRRRADSRAQPIAISPCAA
jgi:hypothetical protein